MTALCSFTAGPALSHSSGQDFRRAGARAQKPCQFGLAVAQLPDGIAKRIDRIEVPAGADRPAPGFIDFDQCQQNIRLVAFGAGFRSTPQRLDLTKRGSVLFVGANRSDVHYLSPQNCDPLALAAGEERFGPCPVDYGIRRLTGEYLFRQGPRCPGVAEGCAARPRPGADLTSASGTRRVRAPDSPPLPASFTSALSASQEAGPHPSTQMTRVNGANAQKNTGPLSPGGKTNSSRNAKKHALF